MEDEQRQFQPVVDSQFVEDIGDVVFYGLFADPQFFSDFFIGMSRNY
ncbi:MAG: hypothetical protein P8Z37_19580 [Acidobacteriota bacterium]